MSRKSLSLIFALLGGLFGNAATAGMDDTAMLRAMPAMLRLSYEVLDLGKSETMGLAGVHYLVNLHPDWYLGASGFGALQGERGGFFTGGFTLGTGRRFASKWLADAGLFVGGGGGGAAPQGSGLMLRPHLNISRDIGGAMLGAGVSYITFPDGDIDSTQLNLSLGIPFDVHYGRARDTGKPVYAGALNGLELKKTEWLATLDEYRPLGSVKTTLGTPMNDALKRVGFEYRRHIDSHRFFFVETAGAAGGDSDGFAELLAGAGYRIALTERLHLGASLAAGGAGGGKVDTGGGLVAKARLGLDYDLAPSLKLGLEGGRIESEGSFSANFFGASLGYRMGEVGSADGGPAQAPLPSHREGPGWGKGDDGTDELKSAHLSKWRLAANTHAILDAARKSGDARNLNLTGLKLEKFLTDNVYISGQAHGAYSGGAGGYAVGLFAAGWEMPLRKNGRLSLNIELAAGAAGGGGVDAGGGAIVQPQLGLTWRLNNWLAARVEAGRVKALEGNLDSTIAGAGLAVEFSRPEGRL
jgi:hypothetical protein